MSEFGFNPTQAKPKVVSIDGQHYAVATPVLAAQSTLSHAEVRAAAIERSKQTNASDYGLGYKPAFWQVFTGEETSGWDFVILSLIARMIHEPRLQHIWHAALQSETLIGSYEARTASWLTLDGSRVNMSDLRQAVQDRADELKISFEKVYSYVVTPATLTRDQRFYQLTFSERMEQFKKDGY